MKKLFFITAVLLAVSAMYAQQVITYKLTDQSVDVYSYDLDRYTDTDSFEAEYGSWVNFTENKIYLQWGETFIIYTVLDQGKDSDGDLKFDLYGPSGKVTLTVSDRNTVTLFNFFVQVPDSDDLLRVAFLGELVDL